jgi:hypothetical protein
MMEHGNTMLIDDTCVIILEFADTLTRRMWALTCRGNLVAIPKLLSRCPPRYDALGHLKRYKIATAENVPAKKLTIEYARDGTPAGTPDNIHLHILACAKANISLAGVCSLEENDRVTVIATKHRFRDPSIRRHCAVTMVLRGLQDTPGVIPHLGPYGVQLILKSAALREVVLSRYGSKIISTYAIRDIVLFGSMLGISDSVVLDLIGRSRGLILDMAFTSHEVSISTAASETVLSYIISTLGRYTIAGLRHPTHHTLNKMCRAGAIFAPEDIPAVVRRIPPGDSWDIISSCFNSHPTITLDTLCNMADRRHLQELVLKTPGHVVVWHLAGTSRIFENTIVVLSCGVTLIHARQLSSVEIAAAAIAYSILRAAENLNTREFAQGVYYGVANYHRIPAELRPNFNLEASAYFKKYTDMTDSQPYLKWVAQL